MATATVEIWRDTGFTEGSVEVPSKTSSLPNPNYIFSDLNISASDLFSRFRVPHAFEDLYACSYIRIKMDMNNGEDVTLYGWIDNVTCISDTAERPVTAVEWHIDLWRTYLSRVTIGSGMVKRRPLLTSDEVPPQSYPYRYITMDNTMQLLTANTYYWVIAVLSTTKFVGKPTITIAFPVSSSAPSDNIPVSGRNSETTFVAPSFDDLITGGWDEKLGLDPESIYGVFLAPISPKSDMTSWGRFGNEVNGVSYGTYMSTDLNCISEYTGYLSSEVATDDVTRYAVLGFDGEVIGTLPWGIPVSSFKYRLVIDTTSAYVQIRFDGIKSHSEGLCFTIPLIPISLTSNSWSSYVYSGSRQADLMQMRAEADKSFEQGLSSMASSTVTGVSSGLMMGALGGPLGMMGGALVGGVSSAIGGTMSAVANRSIDYTYNDRFQDITDYRMAHQSNGLLMSGSGFDSARFGLSEIVLAKLSTDEYSQEQRRIDIYLYGVHVSEPRSLCQPLIDNGGPVQITNAVITGTAPASAKRYIKQRLESGVRII